jgi:hypothetical protein
LLVLSFPLMVAAVWATFAAVAHYERSHLAQLITSQLTAGDRRGSLAAVRQLALTPRPLLEPIVAIAASSDRSLARGAQLVLSDLVDQWQQQLNSDRDVQLAVDGIDELAAALDANHESFSAADGPWLTRTVGQLVRLANRVSMSDGLEFTSHCESLLASAGQGHAGAREASPPAAAAIPETSPASNEPRRVDQPVSNRAISQTTDITPMSERTEAAESAFNAPPESAYQRIAEEGPAGGSHSTNGSSSSAATASQADIKSHWDLPAENSDQGRDRGAVSGKSANDSARGSAKTSNTPPAASDAIKSADSRSLLKQWLGENDSTRAAIARELERRGFGRPNSDLVKQLSSDHVEDRVRLVHQVMGAPGVNPIAWLTLLTEDEDAEVRVAAVTLMATSNNPQLAEQAYQTAIHDHDPRVADLSGRLRDRLDSVQRR